MAPNKIPIHFWHIMYPRHIKEGNLRLSPEFVAEYGHLLSDEAVLEVSDGKVWKIRLIKQVGDGETRIWLGDGFRGFLKYYSIEVRHLLYFKFCRSLRFGVVVFDLTACEAVYPISSSSSGGRPPQAQHSMDLEIDGSESDSDSDFNFDDPGFMGRSRGKPPVSAASAGKNGAGASSSRPPQNVVELDSEDSDSDSPDSESDVRASRSKGKQSVRSGKKSRLQKRRPPPMTVRASFTASSSRPPQNVMELDSEDSDSDSPDSDSDVRASSSKGKQPVRSGEKSRGQKRRPPPMTARASLTKADDVWRRLDESRIFQTHGFRVILRKQSEATLRAVGRAIDRNPENPSFLSIIRSHHLRKGNMVSLFNSS
ncbi:B3 domain-containing protein At3g18960 [Linum grandiflorum]